MCLFAGSGTNNRLLRIDDAVGDSHASIPDLLDQGSGDNYTYDAIGNLKSDVSEGTLNIGWNVGGKVTRVLKEGQWLGFDYDVMGNRLLKRLADKRSLYVRDAHGNTMAVYKTQTREEEEDTDRTTGNEERIFIRILHQQMSGGNTVEKTENFLKKFVYPLEGVSSGEVSVLRSTLNYAMDENTDYNDVVEGIEELTGGSTDINKDNFGTLVELWFRNHAWSGSIPAQLYRTRHRKLVQKEVHLYGSSRLGLMERRTNETDFLMLADIQVEEVWNPFNNSYIAENRINTVSSPEPETTLFVGTLGLKRYELCNHLGNVQAVITDRTLPHENDETIDFYIADLLSATDYYPFGMVLPGRSLETDKYRFGFNGKEFDKEWNSGEMTYDYGFRIYDERIIRFLSVDPLMKEYPMLTPYQFAGNKPIEAIDLDGLEEWFVNGGKNRVYGPFADEVKADNAYKNKVWKEQVIISRSRWGASEPVLGQGREYEKITTSLSNYYHTVVVHHAGSDNSPSIKDIQNKHQNGNAKKADVGYHFAIDINGNIYEGRPIDIKGAHVNKANTGMIGVVLLGDFDLHQDVTWGMSDYTTGDLTKMKKSLVNLVKYLDYNYGIDKVSGHHEVNCGHTVCPGDLGDKIVNEVRNEVNKPKSDCVNHEGSND